MGRLLALFVLVPAVELALLIEIGSRIGTAETLLIIAFTGVVGAALARRQGLEVLRTLQLESEAGHLPAEAIVDGVLILLAGALLVTPGVLTDAVGFACLVPGARRVVKRALRRAFERAAQEGRVVFATGRSPSPPTPGPPGPVIDVRPEPGPDERNRPE